jgi:hypothetical protein
MKKQFPDHGLFLRHLVYYLLVAVIYCAYILGVAAAVILTLFQIIKILPA